MSATTILLVSQSFFPAIGGVSTFLIGLSSGLLKLGYHVHALHFRVAKSDQFTDCFPRVRQHEIDATANFSAVTLERYAIFKEELYRKLHGLEPTGIADIRAIEGYSAFQEVTEMFSTRAYDIVREHRVDIINVHDYQLFPVLDLKQRVKKVFSIHTPILHSYPKETIGFLKYIALKADRTVVSIPSYLAAFASGEAEEPIHIESIPPFADPTMQSQLYSRMSHNSLAIPDLPFIIVGIQRFDAKSGHQQLIQGFARFVKEEPGALLVLAGGPSFTDSIADIRARYYQEARDLTAALGIEENVLFVGPVPYPCLGELFDRAHVFCMLSRSECFGLALTEAMSRKIPAVVTDVGGLAYQIRDGIDGIVVRVDDPEALAGALTSLRKEPGLRKSYSESAYRRYLDLFEPQKVMQKYDLLFQSL